MPRYDLIVIGSGPAGEKGAAQAAFFGKRVALIEREAFSGGAAVNTGTLPSKTLRETALYLSNFRQRGLHGVDLTLQHSAGAKEFRFHEERVVSEERARIDDNLTRHRVERIRGDAHFIDAHTVGLRGTTERLEADFILVATGSSPNRPATYPFDERRVYDSDEVVHIEEIPSSMAVIGGGVIGCEYACLFAALGVKVTLIDGRPMLLPFLDHEISRLLASEMQRLGITLLPNEDVVSCRVEDATVALSLKSGASLQTATCLVAAGRNANTGTLELQAAGLAPGSRGQLSVDAKYRTSVPSIYAAGDVIGFPALASTSMEQARIAVVDMFNLSYKTALAPVLPYGVYTIPEVSLAGETEESLQKNKVDYVVGRAFFKDNARGRIVGETHGCVKLLFARGDKKLLGVHVLGEMATELVHVGLTALLTNATADLFIQTCFNYPSLSEAYKYATYDALGKM